MAHGKNITKQQFRIIMRDIKDNFGSVQQIADKNHISPESVRAIRRAKTWPGFNAIKEAKRVKDATKGKQPAPKSADDKLQQKLDIVPKRPITPEYVQELLDGQRDVNLSNQQVVAAVEKLTTILHHIHKHFVANKAGRRWWKRG